MNPLFTLFAGIFVGMANVIPGVSGGTIAVILQVYEPLLTLTSLDIKAIQKNWKPIGTLCIGMGLGVLLFARIMNFVYEHIPIYTNFFFIGIILGSFPFLFHLICSTNKPEHDANIAEAESPRYRHTDTLLSKIIPFALAVLGFCIMLVFFLLQGQESFAQQSLSTVRYIPLFIVGVISAISMLIPGISGSFVLLILGYYELILQMISQFKISMLFMFALGVLCGLFIGSRLLIQTLRRYASLVYGFIFGLVLGSLLQLIPFTSQSILGYSISALSLVLGVAVTVGFLVAGKKTKAVIT